MKGFKVYPVDTTVSLMAATGRRDFYTIYLLTGPRQLPCADGEIERHGTYLLVGNPQEVGSAQGKATRQMGYGCLFTEEFMQESGPAGTRPPWALLAGNHTSIFPLCDEQAAYLTGLFQKMLAEQQSAYCFKDELLRSYLHLVLHEALRLRQPAPKRRFHYYFQRPGSAGGLGLGRGNCRRRG